MSRGAKRKRLMRGYTRRQFLANSAKTAVAATAASAILPTLVSNTGKAADVALLTQPRMEALKAAISRLIPSENDGDWNAWDAGAGTYIGMLLSGENVIYAGGPYRDEFSAFQSLPRAKEMGWEKYVADLQTLYAEGLDGLNARAGGSFASLPEAAQDGLLADLDYEGSKFFAALYDHTMEGVYAHPVYGGNKDYVAWKTFHYQGDVHGVRITGAPGEPWHDFGGYSPEDMARPGGED